MKEIYFSNTAKDFHTAFEQKFWCLCTVTFGQNDQKIEEYTGLLLETLPGLTATAGYIFLSSTCFIRFIIDLSSKLCLVALKNYQNILLFYRILDFIHFKAFLTFNKK